MNFYKRLLESKLTKWIFSKSKTARVIFIKDFIKRKEEECLLIYPEDCIPDGKKLDTIVDLFTQEHIVIYKDNPHNLVPKLIGSELKKAKIKFIKIDDF